MELFLDTANIDEIRRAAAMGVISGVTTNPSLLAREGVQYRDRVLEICEVVDGPISAECISLNADDLVAEGKRIAAWGLTFKARTDDLRESPALEIIGRLVDAGAEVRAYDPAISRPMPGIEVCADPYAACEGADVLVVLTEWDEFKWLDMDKVRESMTSPRIVDARNHLDRSALLRRGFSYQGIGRS